MSLLKKIGLVIGHPTQFEGPLFKYISKQQTVDLEVIYYNSERMNNIYDPELKMDLNWGFDLLSGYKYFVVPKKNKFLWLKNKLKNENYDLLIINGYNRKILLYAIILGLIYSKTISLRLDTVEFSTKNTVKKVIKKKIYWIFSKIFNHFLAIGSLTSKYIKEMGINDNNISIFSYVVDNDFFMYNSQLTLDEKLHLKEKLKIPETAKVIISVAKFSEREAPWDLIRAFTLINEQDCHLLLVGDGPIKNELKDYANVNFNRHVTFAGYVNYTELPKYYGISDLFVHCSINEPWGVSVQEAMACGLPVITSEFVGASVDLIQEGQNGFIYKLKNISELKEKILNAFSMNKIEVRRVNDQILENWNYKSTLNTLLRLINK